MATTVSDEKIVDPGTEENSGPNSRTYVRVKRHINDDPPSALILSFKRQRFDGTDEADNQETSTETSNNVFRFAGSIQPDQTIGSFIKDLDSAEAAKSEQSVTPAANVKGVEVSNKARRRRAQEEAKQKSSTCRYKIVNTKRGLDDTVEDTNSKDGEEVNPLFSMLELVHDEHKDSKSKTGDSSGDVITCNGIPMVVSESKPSGSEKEKSVFDYVYDVYCIEKSIAVEDQHVDVEHLYENNEMLFDEENSEEDQFEDEVDSNDENNPDNDYPDEEENSEASDEEKYYGYGAEDLYEWSDGEGAYGDSDQEPPNRAMKDLARHMRDIRFGEKSGSESSS